MIRPKGDPVDRGAWFDFWRGSAREWDAWHERTAPQSLPAEKRRHAVYSVLLSVAGAAFALGLLVAQ